MSKRRKMPEGAMAVFVRCANPRCREETVLVLPGDMPFRGGTFQDPGWSVLNEPKEGDVVFSCPACFEKEMADQEKSDHPLIRGEG